MRQASEDIDVLHVEDDPDMAGLTAEYLERVAEEISVETAHHPDEGLELIQERPVDCIVSDYDMPDRNGIELLEAVRAEYEDLPFILFTGKGSEEVASKAISVGVTDYLQKSSSSDQYRVLANRITNATESYRRKRELRRYRSAVETAGDAMYALDPKGYVRMANPEFAVFAGATRDRVLGSHITEFLPLQAVRDGTKAIIELLNDDRKRVASDTFEVERGDGDVRTFENKLSTVEDEASGFTGSVGVLRDVTGQCRENEVHRRRKDQIESYTQVASQDLRDPIRTVQSEVAKIAETVDTESLTRIESTLKLIERLADSLERTTTADASLDTVAVEIGETARRVWERTDTGERPLQVSIQSYIQADTDSLERLFEHIYHEIGPESPECDRTTVTVGRVERIHTGTRVTPLPAIMGFYVEAECPPEAGDGELSIRPTIIREVVAKHGWYIHEEHDGDTVRYEVTGVENVNGAVEPPSPIRTRR